MDLITNYRRPQVAKTTAKTPAAVVEVDETDDDIEELNEVEETAEAAEAEGTPAKAKKA